MSNQHQWENNSKILLAKKHPKLYSYRYPLHGWYTLWCFHHIFWPFLCRFMYIHNPKEHSSIPINAVLILTCANVNWFIYVAYSLIEYTRGLTHFCNLYSNSLIVAESNWMCCWTFPVVLSQTGLKIQKLNTTFMQTYYTNIISSSNKTYTRGGKY